VDSCPISSDRTIVVWSAAVQDPVPVDTRNRRKIAD
jgi:hypothetical protein